MAFFDKVHDAGEILEIGEGKMMLSRATNGDKVAVANVGGEYYAVNDRCAHLGCSLAKARLEGTTITCHCHGSQYDVRSGEKLRGPTKRGVPSYSVVVAGGKVKIEPNRKSQVA